MHLILMITTIGEFNIEFNKIKETGWIRTHRDGPTGIGKTLEDLLGIPENNFDEPDFGDYELKSGRINSTSMLTLFTKSPDARGANKILLEKYGYFSKDPVYVAKGKTNDKVLHATLDSSKFVPVSDTGHKLKVTCINDKVFIESENGIEKNIYWSHKRLEDAFYSKYKSKKLVYVKADTRGSGKNEEFKFIEAYEVKRISFDTLFKMIENGEIKIDLRMGLRDDGTVHDHGTGFRIKESDEYKIFEGVMLLC